MVVAAITVRAFAFWRRHQRVGADGMLILYSTNTYLAYSISESYYRTHFFWCTPYFDPRSAPSLSVARPPPSASPAELYEGFAEDIARSDKRSPRVAQNRSGIVAGATAHKERRRITTKQFNEIVEIVRAAELQDFRPLLFVAAYVELKKHLKRVPVSKLAHPFSQEFIADGVRRSGFDVITLPGRR
jgi:hypothetical protein